MGKPYDEEEDFEVLRAEVQELRGRVNALHRILSELIGYMSENEIPSSDATSFARLAPCRPRVSRTTPSWMF